MYCNRSSHFRSRTSYCWRVLSIHFGRVRGSRGSFHHWRTTGGPSSWSLLDSLEWLPVRRRLLRLKNSWDSSRIVFANRGNLHDGDDVRSAAFILEVKALDSAVTPWKAQTKLDLLLQKSLKYWGTTSSGAAAWGEQIGSFRLFGFCLVHGNRQLPWEIVMQQQMRTLSSLKHEQRSRTLRHHPPLRVCSDSSSITGSSCGRQLDDWASWAFKVDS